MVGGIASTVHDRVAVAPVFPAPSTARTSKVWVPLASAT